MNLQENIRRIKQVMGLNESISNKIKDILIARVPFLKEYKILDNPKDPQRLEARREILIENFTTMMKDEILTFPQVNVSSEVIYYSHVIDDNTFHYFIIKNEIYPMQPKDMDELTIKIFMYALKMFSEKISYRKEIIVKTGESIPSEELDAVINDMNGNLFKFEEYTQERHLDLF
jgi:hypothetical protein